ncbi:hypothetical protein D623_10008425 [Myotis brandtii]|uniref:Uncharacterized protein n=1 Tax=Myotis brandtii TaxID=109478 RepID=S7MGA0_MYOBR|nr:hypothetical protein D623_10008425 [Myotis brandtii]
MQVSGSAEVREASSEMTRVPGKRGRAVSTQLLRAPHHITHVRVNVHIYQLEKTFLLIGY